MYRYFLELENTVDEGPTTICQTAYFETQAQAHAFALLFCFINDGYQLNMMRQWVDKDGTAKDAEFVCCERK